MQSTLRDPGRIRSKVFSQQGGVGAAGGKGRRLLLALMILGVVIGAVWGVLRTPAGENGRRQSSRSGKRLSSSVATPNLVDQLDTSDQGDKEEKKHGKGEVNLVKKDEAMKQVDKMKHEEESQDGHIRRSTLAGVGGALWDCKTTKGDITIRLRPDWAPHGARRMEELLEMGFFTNMTFFRVPPLHSNPIAQFGAISVDDVRVKVSHLGHIPDDPFPIGHRERKEPPHQLKGHFGFGGAGPDSRTWHMWVAREDFSKITYALGRNVWDSSVAEIIEGVNMVDKISVVGDMKPWGNGPDTGKMYADPSFGDPNQFPGKYIKEHFPTIDWFKFCEKRK